MKVKITGIKWDTDGEEADLPSTMEINIPDDVAVVGSEEAIQDYAFNLACQETGWCISHVESWEIVQ